MLRYLEIQAQQAAGKSMKTHAESPTCDWPRTGCFDNIVVGYLALPFLILADWCGDTLRYVRFGQTSNWRPLRGKNIAIICLCFLDIALFFSATATAVVLFNDAWSATSALEMVALSLVMFALRAGIGGAALFLMYQVQAGVVAGD